MDFGVVAEPLGRDGSCGVALTPYVPGMHGKPSRLKPLLGSRSLPSVTLAAEPPLAALRARLWRRVLYVRRTRTEPPCMVRTVYLAHLGPHDMK